MAEALGPFPVAKTTGLLLMDLFPATAENGIPWDIKPFTDAKVVAAPESQVRLIFHLEVVVEFVVEGKTLSMVTSVHLELRAGAGLSWSGFALFP